MNLHRKHRIPMTTGVAVSALMATSACCSRWTGGPGTNNDDIGRDRIFAVPPSAHPPIAPTPMNTPVLEHPRLWIRPGDVQRLRSWATSSNAVYAQGLEVAAKQAIEAMDSGKVPDKGECRNGEQFCEQYAMLMAFMSLVSPEEGKRADYAKRARSLLMNMMNRVAARGASDPLVEERFSLSDRSRWAGEAFGLTVDWIYPHLTDADKKTIRSVFLKWAEEQLHAEITTANHPEPIGMLNDPALVKDKQRRRYAANNYFTAHMRSLVLMALALDEKDDPPSKQSNQTYDNLRGYLKNATGAWLYMTDHVLANDAIGGSAPEGFEYSPRTLGFIAQTYWALETAGYANPKEHGSQVLRAQNPFWKDVVPAFLHSLSPAQIEWDGEPAYEPAWAGDGERSTLLDFIDVFGPLGASAKLHGDEKLYDAARWIQWATPLGGRDGLIKRATSLRGGVAYRQSILYFLLFDPNAPQPVDPRPSIPLVHAGQGLNEIFARTGWKSDATWFTYRNGWASIDHQHGDANSFTWYRKGEWLTKERVGYGWHFDNSDQHNTIALLNSKPNHSDDERRKSFWERGSQWVLGHNQDPKMLARSIQDRFIFATGEATGMYNSDYESVNEVEHASRSIVWLKPDAIAIYDRVKTKDAGRFKRFWLHTSTLPKVEGTRAVVTTPKGQSLSIDVLLPKGAQFKASAYSSPMEWPTKPVDGEAMKADLMTQAPDAKETRFLHVLQALDSGTPARSVQLPSSPECEGASFGVMAVVFSREANPFASCEFTVPQNTKSVLVTGMTAKDKVTVQRLGGGKVKISKGGSESTDEGGALWLDL